MAGTYSISCHCYNCDKSVTIELSKGTPAEGKHECPNCGCKTASKKSPEVKRELREYIPHNYPPPRSLFPEHWLHIPEPRDTRVRQLTVYCSDQNRLTNGATYGHR